MKNQLLISIVGLSLVLTACGPYSTKRALHDVNEGFVQTKTDRPACEIRSAEYSLDTSVIALEVKNKNGLRVGFDILNKFLNFFKLSFKSETGRLLLGMSLYDPLKPHIELMPTLGEAKMSKKEFSFDIGLQNIGVGFEHYSTTPMSTLVERALRATMTNLQSAMAGYEAKWSTTVVRVANESEVIIPVGSFAGVREGDVFNIYNIVYEWDGVPCESEYFIPNKVTDKPTAIGKVVQVAESAAVLQLQMMTYAVDGGVSGGLIEPGALVEINKLPVANPKDPARTLRRSLEIGHINSAVMPFENPNDPMNPTKVDFSRFVKEQINAVAKDHGFIIYNRK